MVVDVNKSIIKTRVRQLKAMHELMCCTNYEEIYYSWVTTGVPDCPLESDFESIAEDDKMYNDCVDLFIKLISRKGYRW